MPDGLKKIFTENLFPKTKDRNWERIADRTGEELYGELCDMFPHPDMAVCAVVHATASLIMNTAKDKRQNLIERLKEAIGDRIAMFEEEEEDAGPGDNNDEDLENEDDVDFASGDVPERPSPEPVDDDDHGLDDDDPNDSTFNDNKPANVAGFQPKKRRPESR